MKYKSNLATFNHIIIILQKGHWGPVYRMLSPLEFNSRLRCLDIGGVGRGVAYALGHANMPGEVTRRAALRGDGLSKMSKLA